MENEQKPDDSMLTQEQDINRPAQNNDRAGAPVTRVSDEEAESALSRAYRQYSQDSDQDTFIEVIVRRKMQGSDYAKIAGIFLGYFVLLLVLFLFGGTIPFLINLLPLFLIGGAFGAWWLITSLNKEFEYVVTKGDLDVDMIVAQRRRKRAYSVKAKDIEIMASCKSDDYRTYSKQQNLKVKNLAAQPGDPANWFIVSQYEGARTMAIITGNEKVIKNMYRFSRSKVRYNPAVGII